MTYQMGEAGSGLRLLSLDGGGIRGLSELIVLREIMQRIKHDAKLQTVPRPCEYFDMIGGTSTGGLIALMLGRLRLTIDEAIHQYSQLAKHVFSETKWWGQDGKFKENRLEEVIKEIVKSYGVEQSPDERMMDPRSANTACKTFVCAMPAHNMSGPRIFRTYTVRENQNYDCMIWQAARATSAAPTFFKRIWIGEQGSEEEFVDAGLGCNNPVRQVLEESEAVFGPGKSVACIISIGTGQSDIIGLRSPDAFQSALPLDLVNVLKKIATDCESAAEDVEKRFKRLGNVYFRFNVEQGLQGVTLAEWEKLGQVTSHTMQYIQKSAVTQKINAAVEAIKVRQGVISTAELNGPIVLGMPSASVVPQPNASNSIFLNNNINFINASSNSELDTLTHMDVPQLVHILAVADGGEPHSGVGAAECLLRVAKTAGGPDHIVTAVVDENILPQLVNHLSNSGPLMQHTAGILAYILRFPHTWDTVLATRAIPLLVALLSDSVLGTQVDAACSLAHITGAERGKHEAARAGAMPPLVVALGRPSRSLTKVAVRAVRNIASIEVGRQSAYASNAIQPLIALLDSRPLDVQVQYDAVKALACIAARNKPARKAMRGHGLVAKLRGLSNVPIELKVAADELRDDLR